ncbi:unnamed protein product, partial [Discosporangium mesarthrocarpum]
GGGGQSKSSKKKKKTKAKPKGKGKAKKSGAGAPSVSGPRADGGGGAQALGSTAAATTSSAVAPERKTRGLRAEGGCHGRRVTFGNVSILELTRDVGGCGVPTDGSWSLALGAPIRETEVDVDGYEKDKEEVKKKK